MVLVLAVILLFMSSLFFVYIVPPWNENLTRFETHICRFKRPTAKLVNHQLFFPNYNWDAE